MTTPSDDNLADFPIAPEVDAPRSMYDAARDPEWAAKAAAKLGLDRDTLTPEGAEHLQKMARATDYVRAVKAQRDPKMLAAIDKVRQRTVGNVHETLAEGDTAEATPESDYDAASLAAELELPNAVPFANADEAIEQTRNAINHILGTVSDDELLQVVQANPDGFQRFRADFERQCDRECSPSFGFAGKRDEQQQRNVEVATANAIRQIIAHHKLKAPAPSLKALISRSRIAAGDAGYAPGRKGAIRELAKPADTPRSIHHLLMSNPF